MLDYADFLSEMIDRLDNNQKRAVEFIDNKLNFGFNDDQLSDLKLYKLQTLAKRREKHNLVLMYRLSLCQESDYITFKFEK